MVGRAPWSARDALVPLFSEESPYLPTTTTRPGGPAADEGVRPTKYSRVRSWEK
jgi:hypothetical protein